MQPMRVNINDIGTVKRADLVLEGLTVLAGPNGSGKTTVSKAIKSCLETIIEKDKISRTYTRELFSSEILGFLRNFTERFELQRQRMYLPSTRREITKLYDSALQGNYESIETFLRRLTIDNFDQKNEENLISAIDLIENFTSNIPSYTKELLDSEKNYQAAPLNHIFKDLQAYVKKDGKIAVKSNLDGNPDSLILDVEFDDYKYFLNYKFNKDDFFEDVVLYDLDIDNYSSHNIGKLNIDNSIMLPVAIKLEELIEGKIEKENDFSDFTFKDKFGNIFDMEFVASGIRALAPFFVMVDEGRIRSNTILIIDEPETNLHPEWQVKFAQIITMLVDNGVTVLVSTHSPIFISALQKYSILAKIEKSTNYYLAEKSSQDGGAVFHDCTEDVDKLLNSLFRPFHKIVWMSDDAI